MKFDSNRAWKEASATVSANREVLFALAGVFFMLPSLAFALLYPQPQAAPDMQPEQAMAMVQEFYVAALPWLIPITILQGVGTLSLMALFTDRTRPTVGEAIRLGFAALVPYILAQLLFGLAVGGIGALLIGVAAATGIMPLAVVVGFAVVTFAIYGLVRTALSAPVIVVEGERNPVRALARSWRITQGNALRIFVFFLLLGIVALLVTGVASGLIGIVAALVAGPKGAEVAGAIVSSAFGAVITLYMVSVLASVHRQLSGGSPEAIGRTFE